MSLASQDQDQALDRLLVKSGQIARAGLTEEGLGRGSCKEAEIVHHVGLVRVAGGKCDFGEGFAGVPQTADMLQTGDAAEGFGRGAHGRAEVSFQRALAHGGMAGDGGNGSAALGAADEFDRGLDLRRDGESVLGLDPA
jgi:hypothetical protein